ncbi:retrotransposon-derived protein PEG10 isoform X1 [Dunckerocampus dactyliophorus]|uniref:retrotransposon-derived protein PEG10 isoform X1 n=1 Tax=Dunckerocampus dactyliophorus TaxID=161453 RepID=UPI002405BCF9|nr:retrotransposon-derived protein PEG10 isoform X1 [Dunckerocampus dactyliophorus]
MDPADMEHFRSALAHQGQLVGGHEKSLQGIMEAISVLSAGMDALNQRLASTSSHPPPEVGTSPHTLDPPNGAAAYAPVPNQPHEPNIPHPSRFSGDSDSCNQFLHQCSLVFDQQPTTYSSDQSKVAFIMSLLSGRAATWAMVASTSMPAIRTSLPMFLEEIRRVFHHPIRGMEAASQLLDMKQRGRPVADFSIDFRVLAVESGYPDTVLRSIFRKALDAHIKDELVAKDNTTSLNGLINLAIELENRMKERVREYAKEGYYGRVSIPTRIPFPPPEGQTPEPGIGDAVAAPPEVPMQLGGRRLAAEERARRRKLDLCLYCGNPGHRLLQCPIRPHRLQGSTPGSAAEPKPRPRSTQPVPEDSPVMGSCEYLQNSVTTAEEVPLKRLLIQGVVINKGSSIDIAALIDSGADDCFLDTAFVLKNNISMIKLPASKEVWSLDRRFLAAITHQTEPLTLHLSGNHSETIRFYVMPSQSAPLVLGLTWLKLHNPLIDWNKLHVSSWSPFCHANCLRSARSDVPSSNPPEEEIDLTGIPSEYHDLKQVFSKDRAQTVPPHRPYDCAIELLPNATFPSAKLYNISTPEQKALKEYISSSLAAGLIRPSSSPLGAGFFFVAKKDKSLRPCIDYRGLNSITVRNSYSLPLMDSAFSALHSARIFSKLDLRNDYHLVRIKDGDEWKTAFNTPLGHFEYLVMPFGLTNAPAVFQNLINDVLSDMINQFCFVYLDDILIFSRNLQDHITHVRLVLQRLMENRLYVKAEKCDFHATSVPFLGYIVEKGQLRADPAKIQAVVEWPTPKSRKHLQRFLGFANFYRRFIRNFSSKAGPLTRLTSPKIPFVWTPEANSAFNTLKTLFTSAPVLVHPDPNLQFSVEVDASDTGVGAVLSQRSPVDQKLHLCAFFSRRLTQAEGNYDVGNRELLAIVLALREWRHWLEDPDHAILNPTPFPESSVPRRREQRRRPSYLWPGC